MIVSIRVWVREYGGTVSGLKLNAARPPACCLHDLDALVDDRLQILQSVETLAVKGAGPARSPGSWGSSARAAPSSSPGGTRGQS